MGPGDPGRQNQGGELSVFASPRKPERERNPFAIAIRPDSITLWPDPGNIRRNTK